MEKIDLNTNGKEIGKAYDEIRNCTSSNTWVVFGYKDRSSTIVVKETGEDWDELVDEMSASKILYAYARVLDPNTNLNKFVLINWSGAGVPSSVKGPCTYHIPDMERLLHTKHVTIHARNEDDLDEKLVKDKVSKSSGSNYSFHKEKPKKMDAVAPVGAKYKKTDAVGEITASDRSKFWQKQDSEEQTRMRDESERMTRTRSDAERDQKLRDHQESSNRDKQVEARQRNVETQKAQEREEWKHQQDQRKRREQEDFDQAGREMSREKEQAMGQVPTYRQEASNIRGTASAFSEHESSAPAAPVPSYREPEPAAPVPSYREPEPAVPVPSYREPEPAVPVPSYREPEPAVPVPSYREPERAVPVPSYREPEPAVPVPSYREPEPEPEPAAMKAPLRPPLPEEVTTPSFSADPNDLEADEELTYDTPQDLIESDPTYDDAAGYPDESGQAYSEIGTTLQQMAVQDAPAQDTEDIYDEIPDATPTQAGFSVRAIYDYAAAEEGEISFDPGDIITNVDPIDEGWWQGTAPNGEYGLFPATYVEMV